MSSQAEVEAALAASLTAEGVKAATAFFQTYVRDPMSVPVLVSILTNSPDAVIRHSAVVMLNKKTNTHWNNLPVDMRTQIQDSLLHSAFNDPEFLVRKNIMPLITTIARFSLRHNAWPALMPTVVEATKSQVAEHREMAYLCICELTSILGQIDTNNLSQVLQMCTAGLEDSSLRVRIYSMHALGYAIEFSKTVGELQMFTQFNASIQTTIAQCFQGAPVDMTSSAIAAYLDLLDKTVMVTDNITDVITFMLRVACTPTDESVRILALNFVFVMVKQKPKCFLTGRLLEDTCEAVMQCVMCPVPPDDPGELTLHHTAVQFVDLLALVLPPTRVMQTVLSHAGSMMGSADFNARKGALLATGMLAEGAQEQLKPMLSQILPMIYAGMSDPVIDVVEAAAISLSLFAEYLEPDVQRYHADILPRLFALVDVPDEDVKFHAAAAIDNFVEHLEDDVVTYIDPLMRSLLSILQTGSRPMQGMTITCIMTVASVAGENFRPYYEGVMPFMAAMMKTTNNAELDLRARATEAVGVIAKAVGIEMFQSNLQPFIQAAFEGMTLGVAMLREFTYSFFTQIAGMLGEGFAPYLPSVVEKAIETCLADDKYIVLADARDGDGSFADAISSDDEDEGDGFNGGGGGGGGDAASKSTFIIPHDLVNERGSAVTALGGIAKACPNAFAPYVERAISAIDNCIGYAEEDVRKNAPISLQAVSGIVFATVPPPVPGVATQLPQHVVVLADHVVCRSIACAAEDEDVIPVQRALDNVEKIATTLGYGPLVEHMPKIMTVINLIFQKQLMCQQPSSDSEDEDDGELPLLLEILEVDCVCAVLDGMSSAFGPQFGTVYGEVERQLLRRIKPSRKISDRIYVLGVIGNIAKNMGTAFQPFCEKLFPLVMEAIAHEDPDLVRNAVFCMSMMYKSEWKELGSPNYFGNVLVRLQSHFSPTTDGLVRDNACSCVATMIMMYPSVMPIDQLVPAMVSALPLKSDVEECENVFRCLLGLAQGNAPSTLAPGSLEAIVMGLGYALEHVPQDVQATGCAFVQSISKDANLAPRLQAAMSAMSGDPAAAGALANLNSALNTSLAGVTSP